jgi:hypothetical protein
LGRELFKVPSAGREGVGWDLSAIWEAAVNMQTRLLRGKLDRFLGDVPLADK